MTVQYPLSAIVGQEAMIEALLINAVDPTVGGVLVRGERGTAKSTAVRALAPLLPQVLAAKTESFAFAPGEHSPNGVVPEDADVAPRPAPLVELPLGATLDRLLGSIDLGRALAGDHAFEAGLLARAHQGILYVDEVNLLPDHLVDALLDAAASGVAVIEREAVSAGHAARFLLVGTMNAEEGELRPQLLDRFGLSVTVESPKDPSIRAEIVRRRLDFEADPDGFVVQWRVAELGLAERIARARVLLARVELPDQELFRIASACARLHIDGARGDIVCARTARVLAALDGCLTVDSEHVQRAARLALSHRRRRDPLEQGDSDEREIERALDDDEGPDDEPPSGGRPPREPSSPSGAPGDSEDNPESPVPAKEAEPQLDARQPAHERHDAPVDARLPEGALRLAGRGGGPAGRRAQAVGRTTGAIDSRPASPTSDDLSVVASLRERICNGVTGRLQEHVRSGREGALLCLVVDASGSMGARRRLARIKGALLEVLHEAYVHRDRVAVIAFRDGEARVLLEPGAPLERAAAVIRSLSAGGRTPLAAGLTVAERLITRERAREPNRRAIAVVLTDGRVPGGHAEINDCARRLGRVAGAVHIIDVEEGPVHLGFARVLAQASGASLHHLGRSESPGRSKTHPRRSA